MPDPLTLTALGAVALTEGIKFLYNQAGELLKRHRERKRAAEAAAAAEPTSGASGAVAVPAPAPAPAAEPIEVRAPDILEGRLAPVVVDEGALERLGPQLRDLRRDLGPYADDDDPEPVDPADERLIETVDALRQAVEAVWGQRITFKGERREASGPLVEGSIDVEVVAGRAIAVRARHIADGARVKGEITAERVEAGAEAIGVDADTIGGGAIGGAGRGGGV